MTVPCFQFPANSSSISSNGHVATCVAMNRWKVTLVSGKVFALLSGLTQTGVAVVTAVFLPSLRLCGLSAKT